MSTINRLAASDVKKGALRREHQNAVENALRAFGIRSENDSHPILRGVYGCKRHEKLEFYDTEEARVHSHTHDDQCRIYEKFYLPDNYIELLNLDIESDGKAHSPKGQRARDEKRDAYLESLGIHVLRFQNSTPAIAIAQVVSLMKMYKEGREK